MATEPDTAEQLVRLFAEESRARAFAAVALGAGTPDQVARTAALSPRQTVAALRRLREQGAVTTGDDGNLRVAYEVFRARARADARRERGTDERGTDERGTGERGTGQTDMVLRTFVRDGRLVRLPARWTRKKLVLRHIAEQTFEPGVEYPERTVDAKLRAWCEDSDEIDHVTLRRYLVDLHHLHRSEGVYRRPAAPPHDGAA
ncbi:DUF2087 domain-containing protein [Streptomyces sp. KAU_LT]|uniref:DUF2087 domain-containing protein n=1 Tax=Streptomyces sp. KAU_LT TaxID=3046669 RepID=UPI0024B86EB9|nr:DUF2087 domain-containing protein [Streptomyces sp. KAU_LT]MDI9834870.1 DUF2087 domain-containing protein [Streptomyces sp. KAU_LT]